MSPNFNVDEFTRKMEKENTEYLIRIWNSEHRDDWGEEKLKIVGEILASRGENVAQPKPVLLKQILAITTHIIQPDKFEYLGIVSSVVVLGTGFLSEFESGVADFLGTRSSEFQDKLELARATALEEMKEKTIDLGGDAVIGVDFDYMNLQENILMVSANGTAVKIIKPEDENN